MKQTQPARGRAPLVMYVILAGLAFSAFLTGTKLLPFLANNVGVFEVLIVGLGLVMVVYMFREEAPIRFNRMIGLVAAIATVGLVSQFAVPQERLGITFVQMLIPFSLLLFAVVMYNLFVVDPGALVFFLRCLAYGGAAIGVWLFVDQIQSPGDINAAGPFRNRAHAGIYLFAAFWFVVVYLFLPNRPRIDALVLYPSLALALYGIAVAGRRSVYIALIVGLATLGLGLFLLRGTDRFKSLVAPLLIVLIATGLYFVGSEFVPQLRFFQVRVAMVGTRVETFYSAYSDLSDAEVEDSDDFITLQRKGGIQAFSDHPLLGIGYGGFYASEYSPTGHEMHSTPLKFLAETGLVGFLLYVALMGVLIGTSVKTFLAARGGPYQLSALMLLVAIVAGGVSYIYNRQMTDRTFWILLVLISGFPLLLEVGEPRTTEAEGPAGTMESSNVPQY
ncbi:MAG: O-antigen ligase family protein [Anaerolineae bacterium]|nr:O-antigen ligase family protein [Anaerolineae bacterium]